VSRVSVLGMGFIGSRYCQLYPHEVTPEARDCVAPTEADVLHLRSTISNYNVLNPATLKLDTETNIMHLLDVLPNGRGTFTWTGTWFVWGKSGAGATAATAAREGDPCLPTGLYSASKLHAEHIIRSYVETAQAGLVSGPRNYRILRLCNVIGNDPRAGKQKNALEMMLRRVVRGEEVEIYDGEAYRNILHVDDVARAIHLCLTQGPNDTIINIGNTSSTRMFDLIQHAKHVTGSKSRVTLVKPPRFHEIVQTESFHMDVTKLRGLGFVPQMDAYEAVERVIAGMIP